MVAPDVDNPQPGTPMASVKAPLMPVIVLTVPPLVVMLAAPVGRCLR